MLMLSPDYGLTIEMFRKKISVFDILVYLNLTIFR